MWLPRGIPHGYAAEGGEPLRTLVITLPAGFDRFVAEAGTPAGERTLPPPTHPAIDRLVAVATAHGSEILGPLDL